MKWKHFPRYWPFMREIHRSAENSRNKGRWRGALMFCLICGWINGWVNNREAGDLRRHTDRPHKCFHLMTSSCIYCDENPCCYYTDRFGMPSRKFVFSDILWAPWRLKSLATPCLTACAAQHQMNHQSLTLLALYDGNPPISGWLPHKISVMRKAIHGVAMLLKTHLSLVPHICISLSGQHWFR